jgi:hypothetical protein
MRIIDCLAASALLIAAAPAAAQSWYRVGGDPEHVGYVDADSLSGDTSLRLGNIYTVYGRPLQGLVFASMVHVEFDCAGHYFRTLEYSYYGAGNALLDTQASTHPDDRQTAEPESLNAYFLRFACEGTGGTAVGGDAWTDAQTFLGSAAGPSK